MEYIVQAEFFHMKAFGKGLEAVIAEAESRIRDNARLSAYDPNVTSGIKTVVRFMPVDTAIYNCVSKIAEGKLQTEIILRQLRRTKGVRRFFLMKKLTWLARREERRKNRIHVLVVQELQQKRTEGSLAVSRGDHSFRYAAQDELYDLFSAARKAQGLWVFVFESDSLLADKLTCVVSTTF